MDIQKDLAHTYYVRRGHLLVINPRHDRELQMERCAVKAPLLAEVVERGGSWPALWDAALHLGSWHTTSFQSLSRMLAHHRPDANPYPLCDDQFSDTYIVPDPPHS